MENSKIAWTDHTFNPWVGCEPVSPGCANCYAAALSKRWGKDFSKRIPTSETYWKQPHKWQREAENTGTRPRVFCGSMCDVCDDKAPKAIIEALALLIDQTPNLDWLLLTKRPENMGKFGAMPANAHWGVTAENQEMMLRRVTQAADRTDKVFVSCEPMIGHITILPDVEQISWLIIGAEKIGTSPGRDMCFSWVNDLIETARAGGIPVFVKQMELRGKITDDITRFPEWAQIREEPRW